MRLSRRQMWHDTPGTLSSESLATREIRKQVALLSDGHRQAFWTFGQAPIYGQTPTEQGIFWTNCIDVVDCGGGGNEAKRDSCASSCQTEHFLSGGEDILNDSCAAMYILTSRLNHSCAPNVIWRSELGGDGQLATVAARDIEEGEEILISYMRAEATSYGEAVSLPHYLQRWYGFTCCCGHCQGAMPIAAQSIWAQVLASGGGVQGGTPSQGFAGVGASGNSGNVVLSEDPDEVDFI